MTPLSHALLAAIELAESRGADLRTWWTDPSTQDALKALDEEERRAVIARKDQAKGRMYGRTA